MLRGKTITTLLLTATLAACGGGEEAAMGEMEAAPAEAQPQQMASAQAEADLSQCFLRGATLEEAAERPSPLEATAFTVGSTEGQICYGAPSARDREVMGALVPYGEPWRTGANEATALHLEGPAVVGGIPLEAGSYSLYTIPAEGEWEVFVNSNFERWGIPISPEVRESDVGSFTVQPESMDEFVETMQIEWQQDDQNAGHLVLQWENTRVPIPVMASGM